MRVVAKSAAFVAVALLSLAPAFSFADEAGPPPDAAPPAAGWKPSPERMADMRQMRSELESVHQQARLQMLGALTPQHREQFAAIVGQLAIAATPDVEVAAKQIDTMLSVREARAVLAAESTARADSKALMDQERAKFEASLTPDERAKMEARESARPARPASARSADPGFILLRATVAGGPHREGPPGAL
jgi:hypothetical protein